MGHGLPTGGWYLHVQRERMLGAVGGGAADSSRTGWVPNCFDPTPCYFSRDRSATFHVNLTTLGAGRAAPKSLSALAIAFSMGTQCPYLATIRIDPSKSPTAERNSSRQSAERRSLLAVEVGLGLVLDEEQVDDQRH